MVLSEGPLSAMSTGPLLALDLAPGQPFGLQIERSIRGLIRSRRAARRRLAAVDARARGRSRRLARRRRRRVRAARGRGLHRAAPRRGSDRRRAGREPEDVAGRVRRADRRRALQPPARPAGSRALPARATGSRPAAPRSVAPRTPTSRTASRSAPPSCGSRLAPFLARTRGVVASADRTGVFAGSTHALFVLASRPPRAGRAPHRGRGSGPPLAHARARRLGARGRARCRSTRDGLRVDLIPGRAGGRRQPGPPVPARRRALAGAPARARRVGRRAATGSSSSTTTTATSATTGRPPGRCRGSRPEHVAYVGSASALLAPTRPHRLGCAPRAARRSRREPDVRERWSPARVSRSSRSPT